MQKAKAKPRDKGKPKSKEPKTLSGWLKLLFAAWRIPVTDEAVTPYVLALKDLTVEEQRLAFVETFRRHKSFPPVPGEIREYLQVARERNPVKAANAHGNCPRCGGVGWIVTPRGAVPCVQTKTPALS